MTKELLLNELNRNNEFNELNTPDKLSSLLNKPVYIINKIFIDGVMYNSEVLGCSYASLDKEFILKLENTSHKSWLDSCHIYCEGFNNNYGFTVSPRYDQDADILGITLQPLEDSEDGGTPNVCYIDIILTFMDLM